MHKASRMREIILVTVLGSLLIIEAIYSLTRKDGNVDLRETVAHVVIFAVYWLIVTGLVQLALAPAYTSLHRYAPLRLPASSWWSLAPAILSADFVAYWAHRVAHVNPLLWAMHSSHHSSPRINLSTSLRLSWAHGVVNVSYALPFALLGVPFDTATAAVGVISAYSFFVHTAYVPRLPHVLELVLLTPSAHRVHHASNAVYLDKNFGALLAIWDRLFGTYVAESKSEPLIYGTVEPRTPSNNPCKIELENLVAYFHPRRGQAEMSDTVGQRDELSSRARRDLTDR